MTTLILSDEQAQVLRDSPVVELRDRAGNLLGKTTSADLDEDFRVAKERQANMGKTFTTAEVMEHLRALAPE